MIGVHIDISAKKTAELALATSKARLQAVDVMVLGGWSNRAMLSRYGAYAASERAFAAVASRAEALEPWGRPLQAPGGELVERRAGG